MYDLSLLLHAVVQIVEHIATKGNLKALIEMAIFFCMNEREIKEIGFSAMRLRAYNPRTPCACSALWWRARKRGGACVPARVMCDARTARLCFREVTTLAK